MADFRKWMFAFALIALLAGMAVPASAQLTPIVFAPSHVYGVFGTSEGNGGAFFGEQVSGTLGLYSKTVATFSGSDSTGAKCLVFKPNCSATSDVVTGFEKIIAQSSTGRLTATCDGGAGISTSGSNTGFAWGAGCHGWVQLKKGGSLYIGFSPRWTKDNVGPNSGKLTFNFDVMHATK